MTIDDPPDDGPPMSIAAVQRDSGLSKDTLRAWERRYGFPDPLRDAHDERLYPPAQIAKLRLLRRLVEAGHRPGKIVGRPADELAQLVRGLDVVEPQVISPEAQEVLARLAAYDVERLRAFLAALVVRSGLRAFAADLGPALAQVIPVAVMTTYPAMALLGRLSAATALFSVGVAIAMLVGSRMVWRAAIRNYTSASS